MPEILEKIFGEWQNSLIPKHFEPVIENAGSVMQVGDGVALVSGLSDTFIGEILQFEAGLNGYVLSLGSGFVGVVLLARGRRFSRS